MTEKIHVTIGQVQIARPGQSLHAILGSCIGIGVLFAERQIYGLSHCLLSKGEAISKDAPGRHVNSAIQTLTQMMQLTPPDLRKVRVILAGGANMTMPADTDPKRLVGTVNANFARAEIKKAGFRILQDDLGGLTGRQVTINGDDGTYAIAAIPRLGG